MQENCYFFAAKLREFNARGFKAVEAQAEPKQ